MNELRRIGGSGSRRAGLVPTLGLTLATLAVGTWASGTWAVGTWIVAVARAQGRPAAEAPRASAAADWPQWRGPQRDGRVTVPLPASWAPKPSQVWKVTVGIGHASPLVANGRVYLLSRQGDEETASALDLQTGKAIWTQRYPAPYRVNSAASSHGAGPKSTPVLHGGRLYALGISGILSCFDAATGAVRWRKTFEKELAAAAPEYGTAMSPIVDSGLVLVHVGGGGAGALRAFDADTGQTRWSWTEDGPAYASPIVIDVAGTRQLVTQTQRFIVGIGLANGATLWRQPFTTSYDQNSVTPLAYKDMVIFSGLEQATFALRIARPRGTAGAAAGAAGGARGAAAAGRAATGGAGWTVTKVWENATVSMYMSSPVLHGDRLFGLSHRNRGQFFALDAATGKTLWTSPPRQGENASIVAAGSVLFMLTNDANLIVTDATAAGFTPIAKYEVATSPTWAHPVVLGSRVLVKDEQTLALLTIGAVGADRASEP